LPSADAYAHITGIRKKQMSQQRQKELALPEKEKEKSPGPFPVKHKRGAQRLFG